MEDRKNAAGVVPFSEDIRFPGANRTIIIDAASYRKWLVSVLPQVADMPCVGYEQAPKVGAPVGCGYFYSRLFPVCDWISLFPFSTPKPRATRLKLYRGRTVAYVCFTEDVAIPVLCDANLEPWMSLTPNEVVTQRGQVRRAKGNVGMAGLGLGWAARRVLERSSVTRLQVYERDPEIAAYFGKPLQQQFGERLQIVVQDAYEADWKSHDVALWDIWPGWGDASDDSRYMRIRNDLRAAGKVCVGWGEGVYSQD